MTVVSKSANFFVTRIIFVNKIDFGHETAEMEDETSVPAVFLFSSAKEKVTFLETRTQIPQIVYDQSPK